MRSWARSRLSARVRQDFYAFHFVARCRAIEVASCGLHADLFEFLAQLLSSSSCAANFARSLRQIVVPTGRLPGQLRNFDVFAEVASEPSPVMASSRRTPQETLPSSLQFDQADFAGGCRVRAAAEFGREVVDAS